MPRAYSRRLFPLDGFRHFHPTHGGRPAQAHGSYAFLREAQTRSVFAQKEKSARSFRLSKAGRQIFAELIWFF